MKGLYILWTICVCAAIIIPICIPRAIKVQKQRKLTDDIVHTELDVVITCHPKDTHQLENCIDGVLKYVKNVQKVYLIMLEEPEFISKYKRDIVVWCNESSMSYPFSVDYFKQQLPDEFKYRAGWYYQQMVKLYCDTIPNIREYVLVIDADTTIVRSFPLFNKEGSVIFGYEDNPETFNDPYRTTGQKLCPNFKFPLWNKVSVIDHHMVFYVPFLQDMRNKIESSSEKPMWEAVGEIVSKIHTLSGFSEYEMYGNYVYQYHPNDIVLHKLNHINTGNVKDVDISKKTQNCDLISLHDYLRVTEEYNRSQK